MAKAKSVRRTRTALTPEARENQMIALAMDLAEQKLRDGTASSQLITEFVKRGMTKERLEKEILEKQKELVVAKTENLKAQKHMDEVYEKAIKAMRRYQGVEEEEIDDDEYYYED